MPRGNRSQPPAPDAPDADAPPAPKGEGICARCKKKIGKAIKIGQNECCPHCGAPTEWKA